MSRCIVLALLAALASAGPLESCYGYEDHLTLMPDRSGKLELILSEKTSDATLDKVKAGLLKIVEDTSGFAAFTAPTLESKDGWAITRFTVYFEDINRFYYVQGRKHDNERPVDTQHEACIHFAVGSYLNDKKAQMLHIEDWLLGKKPALGVVQQLPTWEETRKEIENVVKHRYTMPGKVTRLERIQRMDGRDAFFERSQEAIKNADDSRNFPASRYRRIEFYGSDVPDAEVAAFKKELAAAKAAWPKLKADLEAAKAKK